jgi:hypothetical protein
LFRELLRGRTSSPSSIWIWIPAVRASAAPPQRAGIPAPTLRDSLRGSPSRQQRQRRGLSPPQVAASPVVVLQPRPGVMGRRREPRHGIVPACCQPARTRPVTVSSSCWRQRRLKRQRTGTVDLSRDPEKPVTNQVTTSPGCGRRSQTQPDKTVALTCRNTTPRDAARRNRHAW